MYWRIIGRRDRQWRTDKTIRSPPAPAAAAASPWRRRRADPAGS